MSAEEFVDIKMQKPKYCATCRTEVPKEYKTGMRCVMCIRFGPDRHTRAHAEFQSITRPSRTRS